MEANGTRSDGTSGTQQEMRAALDESRSGAPAAGETLRDQFSTDEIFHRLVVAADEEFSRSTRLLFLSGLAAGLSISLSFVGMVALSAAVPGEGAAVVGSLMYPLGFLFVVVGRYQLFTENTLTPVALVLTRIASIPLLLRVWGCVLLANVIGAGITAYVLATTAVFEPEMAAVAMELGHHQLEMTWSELFWKGVFAGWLVAGMVWLNYAVRDMTSRLFITFFLIFTVSAAGLAHCIVGSAEVLYVVFHGDASILTYLIDFLVPAVLGNTAGGVLLVAILNYSQTRDRRFPDRDCGRLELTWSEWIFGHASGRPDLLATGTGGGPETFDPRGEPTLAPPVDADDHAKGATGDDAIVLTQYGDYECPTSRSIYDAVEGVLEATDDVTYAYRHLPLSQRHPHAELASIAAEAAARQDAFWRMHDCLFEQQDHLGRDDVMAHAQALGLDVEQFRSDLSDDTLRDEVRADRESGLKSGVRRTANLFINGVRYPGPFTADALQRSIRRMRAVPTNEEAVPA